MTSPQEPQTPADVVDDAGQLRVDVEVTVLARILHDPAARKLPPAAAAAAIAAVCTHPAADELLHLPSLRLLWLCPQVIIHLPARVARQLPADQVRAQTDLVLPAAAGPLFDALERDWDGTLAELVETARWLHAHRHQLPAHRGGCPPPTAATVSEERTPSSVSNGDADACQPPRPARGDTAGRPPEGRS